MAALISDDHFQPDEFYIANQNATGYIRDQCCHLQDDGATLQSRDFSVHPKRGITHGKSCSARSHSFYVAKATQRGIEYVNADLNHTKNQLFACFNYSPGSEVFVLKAGRVNG